MEMPKREVCDLVEVGIKNSKSKWWNEEIKITVGRKDTTA